MKIKRIIHNILVVIGLSMVGLMFYYMMYLITDVNFRQDIQTNLTDGWMFLDFSASCMFTTVVTLFYWKSRERAEKERDRLRLQVLDNQLSPHFVFNNFSILAELIEVNPPKASTYLMHLSKVYRYALTHQEQATVKLQDELQFIHHYISLLAERFGDCIRVNIDDNMDKLCGLVPPAVLQMLIENAIKHNEHTSAHPLVIDVSGDEKYLRVKNIKRPVVVMDSANVGLHNIVERYHLLIQKDIMIEDTSDCFCVTLPIIREEA